MKTIIFDIETDDLYRHVTQVHCIVTHCPETGVNKSFTTDIDYAIQELYTADTLIGHNIINYDIPVLHKLYRFKPNCRIIDTFLTSQVMFPERAKHSLQSWGETLDNFKTAYSGGFETFNEEMLRYCQQDVSVTLSLYNHLQAAGLDSLQLMQQLENSVAPILFRQENYGVMFDIDAALILECTLAKHLGELKKRLQYAFPVRANFIEEITPKTNRKPYKEGCAYSKIEFQEFNPASTAQIASRLMQKYNWKPTKKTEKGKPQVTGDILDTLGFPEAQLLSTYFMLNKRMGQLSSGDNAWIRKMDGDYRIRGSIKQNGAVTGRMTHFGPNLAQVPAVGAPYGAECRALFIVPVGKSMVGCDASALEMRCMAAYLYRHDKGEFAQQVLTGDIHQRNADILGVSRQAAKTFFYALIYGAGDAKLGATLGADRKTGADAKQKFFDGFPAYKKLLDTLRETVSERGYLLGLDGRHLICRSEHSQLNTLLQSAGALIMKKALVLFDEKLKSGGCIPGLDYEFILNIHDEFQLEVKTELSEKTGQLGVDAIRDAGKYFNLKCPMDGEFKVGSNWAETH